MANFKKTILYFIFISSNSLTSNEVPYFMIDDVKIFNKYVEKMNKYGWYLFYVPEANYDWRENYNNFQTQ